jgi:hypothetical protein
MYMQKYNRIEYQTHNKSEIVLLIGYLIPRRRIEIPAYNHGNILAQVVF